MGIQSQSVTTNKLQGRNPLLLGVFVLVPRPNSPTPLNQIVPAPREVCLGMRTGVLRIGRYDGNPAFRIFRKSFHKRVSVNSYMYLLYILRFAIPISVYNGYTYESRRNFCRRIFPAPDHLVACHGLCSSAGKRLVLLYRRYGIHEILPVYPFFIFPFIASLVSLSSTMLARALLSRLICIEKPNSPGHSGRQNSIRSSE